MSYRNVIISGVLALGLLPMAAASASAEDPAVNSQLTALQGSVNNLQTTVNNLQAATNKVQVGINSVIALNQANARSTPPIPLNTGFVSWSVVNTGSTVHTIQIFRISNLPDPLANGGIRTLPPGGFAGGDDAVVPLIGQLYSYTFVVTDGSRTDIRASVLQPAASGGFSTVAAE